ncbi:MAG: transcription antitermination factor NusB [Salinarimonas sp.]|nr:transcription antitermination factor NusB [Salinarimonas sp.]
MAKSKPSERTAARLAAVQALYQMEVSGKGVVEVTAEFEAHWIGREIEGMIFNASDMPFFRDLLAGVVREQRGIDRATDETLAEGWPLKRIEAVLRAIFRCAVFELMMRRDVPVRVVINEYVEIAHGFYDGEEPGMVNGVLDAIAHKLRPDEFDGKPRKSGRSVPRGN